MIDLKMDEYGELVLDGNGDLATVYGDEQLAQEILFRLKTTKGDWQLSPNIGCDLEKFIGQPNTNFTRTAIEQAIINGLTFDGLLTFPKVDCVALSKNEVMAVVEFIGDDSRTIQVISFLDLVKGNVEARISRENL
jgi:phage baseplate assembly protein W